MTRVGIQAKGKDAFSAHHQDARRELVRALAAKRPDALAAWLKTHRLQAADLTWLQQQGLASFGFYRLQEAELLDNLPADMVSQWQAIYYETSVTSATLDWETERILTALAQAGMKFIWLKGAALAYTVYPNPACRGRGDLDLWLPLDQWPQAITTLEGFGYRVYIKENRPPALVHLTGGEQKMIASAHLRLVELQWPAMRGEWIRRTTAIDHAGIWERATPIALHGIPPVHVMTPEDTLIHLSVHQAINHHFSSPWLRNLLDIHLLVAHYDLDWQALVTRAREWRLATVVWTVLSLAQRLLDTAVPAGCLERLAPSPLRRRLMEPLHLERALIEMWPGGYQRRRFLIQLLLGDRLRDMARLLWRGVYPEAAWLRARYGVETGRSLWRVRLAHVGQLATSARV